MAYFASAAIKNKDGSAFVTVTDNDGDGFGGLDVNLQDQTTGTVGLFLFQHEDTFTLAANAVVDARTLTVTGGHSITTGDTIMLREALRYSQFQVLNVVTNTITIDSPIDFAYTSASATGDNGNADMAVDGSVTPVVFYITPNATLTWDVTRVIFGLEDATQPDATTFGGIAGGITNGIVLRQKNGMNYNQFNCKTNGDFAMQAYDVSYDDRASPQSDYFVRIRRTFGGASKTGVVLRLDGADSDQLQVIVQDDLTDLLSMFMTAQGHIVE